MPPIDFTKTENLIFEGGGGKGVVYLGVVKALESQGILPIKIDNYQINTDTLPYSLVGESYSPGSDVKVRRIAGSSAGAITAFMLSMGGTAKDIANELKNTQQFIEFFDLPKQISRNHRDGTDTPKQKQVVREVAYQDSELNNFRDKKNEHTSTSPLKGTEIEVDEQWTNAQNTRTIPEMVFSLVSWHFNLEDITNSNDLLRAIFNRDLTDDEWENYTRMSRVKGYTIMKVEKADPKSTRLAIANDFLSHLQLTGGFFPGRQVRLFFYRLLLRYLYMVNESGIELMLRQHTRTDQEDEILTKFLERDFHDAQRNPRVKRFMEIKLKQHSATELRQLSPDAFIDLLVNINFREYFYITGIDLSLTGTNVTRMVPRIFSQAYTPLMPVCEAAAISMNIPFLFSPVILRGNVMDKEQYQNLIANVKQENKISLSEYNIGYKGAYADGGMINNYPIQLIRNEPRFAFSEFILPENRFATSNDKSINKSLGFRLTEPDTTSNTNQRAELQKHLFIGNYLPNILGSLQFYSETGQILTKTEYSSTLNISSGSVGMLDFSPKKNKSAEPIKEAFWKTIFKIRGVTDAPVIRWAFEIELKKDISELTELINLLPE